MPDERTKGWTNKETAQVVSFLYGMDACREIFNRSYSEKITPAKVLKVAKPATAQRYGLLDPLIDWNMVGESIARDANDWGTYG